jgi:hypothetical protein
MVTYKIQEGGKITMTHKEFENLIEEVLASEEFELMSIDLAYDDIPKLLDNMLHLFTLLWAYFSLPATSCSWMEKKVMLAISNIVGIELKLQCVYCNEKATVKEVLNHIKERTRKVLKLKGREYSYEEKNQDRLMQFKEAGRLVPEPPEKILLGFMLKHILAVKTKGFMDVTIEWIDEKCGDVLNYFILLLGLIRDRKDET